MGVIYRWRSVSYRVAHSRGFEFSSSRSFCSSKHNRKPIVGNSSSSNGSASSPHSLNNYDDQYKALQNLDFSTAAKILFSDPPKKKKFGFDFHVVQFFIACLPSLAVYLVAQYARSEMRKMDADLEKKKQAEFEAHAKEMEQKAAEEKAAMESNPQLLEVKERLEKLEERVKEIDVTSKNRPDDSIKAGEEDPVMRKRELLSFREGWTAFIEQFVEKYHQNDFSLFDQRESYLFIQAWHNIVFQSNGFGSKTIAGLEEKDGRLVWMLNVKSLGLGQQIK